MALPRKLRRALCREAYWLVERKEDTYERYDALEKSYDQGVGELYIIDSRKGPSMNESSQLAFKVFYTSVTNLPVEEIRRSDESRVTLAFQLDPMTKKPVVPQRGQYVFAYLPVQRLQQLPVGDRILTGRPS